MQLIGEINRVEIDFSRIARVIGRDLSLTYNLLKLVNSAAFGFKYRIRLVKHAVVALGEREIKKWVYLVVVNRMGRNEPDELTRLSLIRGRFMEEIALHTRYRNSSEELFLLGLFSLLDVILKRPIEEILDELKTSDKIKDALISGKGEFGTILKMMLSYEKGEWEEFSKYSERLRVHRRIVFNAYMEALAWFNELQKDGQR